MKLATASFDHKDIHKMTGIYKRRNQKLDGLLKHTKAV